MKKVDLKKLALMGISGGLMIAAQAGAAQNNTTTTTATSASQKHKTVSEASCNGKQGCSGKNPETSKPGPATQSMSESEFLSKLSPEGKSQYNSLDADGKSLALKLANQSCKGKNDCKGLNSCKSDKNSCAGKGSCAGTSAGPFADKNTAVKVASDHMAVKRKSMQDDE